MPFNFAWVDASETTFDPSVHNREDEDVFGFSVEHSEGDFAGLEIEIRNPRIGLLAPARKVHAWLSWDSGSEIKPLFFGRLVGVPDDIHLEIVRLQFTARPDDYAAQKAALADTLKVRPYYDPIWISADKRNDPDTVLEARSELWHIDRVTGVLTTSDLLVGEDGNEDFGTDEVMYDGVRVHLNQTPLRTVSVDAEVGWTQADTGSLPDLHQLDVHELSGRLGRAGLAENRRRARRRLDGGDGLCVDQYRQHPERRLPYRYHAATRRPIRSRMTRPSSSRRHRRRATPPAGRSPRTGYSS